MDSQERIRGWVESWDDLKNFGIVRDNVYSRKFVAVGSEVQPDKIGRRYLVADENIIFTVGMHNGKRDRALDIRVLSRPLLETYPADYTEECAVEKYSHERGFGFLKRPVGGYLFLHRSNILTVEEESLKPGSLVWAVPVAQEAGRSWLATQVQVLMPETEESVESEPTTLGLALQGALSPVKS